MSIVINMKLSSKSSTSKFGKQEEERMLVNIKAFRCFSRFREYVRILKGPLGGDDDDLCDIMSSLVINEENDPLYTDDQPLLTDIKNVVDNTDPLAPNNENYIDKLVETVLRLSGFDSGQFCLGRPKQVRFIVGKSSFSSNADVHVVRKADNNVLLTVESKHERATSYKAGELQLICHMLASLQANTTVQHQMWGVRMHSCRVYFYFLHCDEVYTRNLKSGKINKSINVARFPCDARGLSVQYRKERIEVFNILSSIKSELTQSQ